MIGAILTSGCARPSTPRARSRNSWMNSVSTCCGRPSIISSAGYEVFPNLIQLGLWLATQTKRLKFGCAFNILPMWHPIRLAEDYAMADIVTDGRIVMRVGRGYHTREVETFGAPLLDAEKNRELFEEQLRLLWTCFNEQSFHFKGMYYECPPPVDYRGYRLKEITMVPRPKHLPVEIWMPIASGKTIELMAQYGLKAMVT